MLVRTVVQCRIYLFEEITDHLHICMYLGVMMTMQRFYGTLHSLTSK